MGFVVEDNNFDTFNLVRDLEKTRDDLYQKQMLKNQKPQTKSVKGTQEDNVPLAIEWIHEESSESEDFIVGESGKKKRESRKSLMLPTSQNSKKITHENPGDLKKRRGKSSKVMSHKIQINLNHEFQWFNLELSRS